MSDSASTSHVDHFFPAIPGLEALFGQSLFAFDSATAPTIGFRRKSSIVIEGPPGSGKTAATLAICRALMPFPANLMYYLSTEVTKERLFKNHAEFGWFDGFNEIQSPVASDSGHPFTKDNLFFAELPRARTDRPLPSSGEQINDIFRGISEYRRKPDRRGHSSLIVVDSLSGLLRDASTSGERRRLTEDFLERLETEFDKDLGLVFLITESSTGRCDDTPLEQYVADYVFRLGYREAPGGRRVRTWDIVKSHGTYMAAGEHTWDFYTAATDESLFFDSDLRRYLWEYREMQLGAARDVSLNSSAEYLSPGQISADAVQRRFPPERPRSQLPHAATIVIYPQWSTYLESARADPVEAGPPPTPESSHNYIWSGTPGLDELLQGDTEYWSRPDKWAQRYDGASWTPGLRQGETTLLLGSSGTLKSWISIQFLAGNIHEDGVFCLSDAKTARIKAYRAETTSRGENWKDKNRAYAFYGPTLFLSFEGEASAIKGFKRTSGDLADLLACASLIYASPASLHINRLLFELRWICRARRVERVAIDGLAELIKCVEPASRTGIVTALLRTLQNAYVDLDAGRARPTIFATYELTPHDRSLVPEPEGVSAICENVLILQHIYLNDQMHKAIYVLKAKDSRHDLQIREIAINPRDTGKTPGVRVQSGFEGFSDLLSGSPKKARVALQLFRENSAEENYNEKIRERLSRTFAFKVTLHTFAHSELSQFLDDARGVLGQVLAAGVSDAYKIYKSFRRLSLSIETASVKPLAHHRFKRLTNQRRLFAIRRR
ncbi:MAG: putative circadian clock protein KaiC [Schlesneria sp.]|nr:putative circadian clock protein KaiC [Schlesneria sp.]